MKCVNCGAEFRNNIQYCMRCGTYLTTGVTVEQKDQISNIPTVNKDLLVKSYVGNSYINFVYKHFSFLFFLFGPLYGFSRKMYLYSFLEALLIAIAVASRALFQREYYVVVAVILIMLLFSFNFKKIYMKKCIKKVDKIVERNANQDVVMLQNICKKAGGLNIFFTIINVIVGIGIASIIVIYILDILNYVDFVEKNYLLELIKYGKEKLIEWTA